MRGISMSRMMTSGISSWSRRAAAKGSAAAPITSMPGSSLRMPAQDLADGGGIVDDQDADRLAVMLRPS